MTFKELKLLLIPGDAKVFIDSDGPEEELSHVMFDRKNNVVYLTNNIDFYQDCEQLR